MTCENVLYVYMLKCKGNCFYTGIAADPEKRLKQHLGLIKGGAKFTARLHPVEAVAAIWRDNTGQYARSLEYRLKHKLKHMDKEKLCRCKKVCFEDFGIDVPSEAFEFVSPVELNEKYNLTK